MALCLQLFISGYIFPLLSFFLCQCSRPGSPGSLLLPHPTASAHSSNGRGPQCTSNRTEPSPRPPPAPPLPALQLPISTRSHPNLLLILLPTITGLRYGGKKQGESPTSLLLPWGVLTPMIGARPAWERSTEKRLGRGPSFSACKTAADQ